MATYTPTGTELVRVLPVNATTSQVAPSFVDCTTGSIANLAGKNPILPTAVNASATAAAGGTYLLSAASGSVLTLPAATGSSASIRVIVNTTVTSNSHKVLPGNASDNMQGIIITNVSGTCTGWNALVSQTFHSLQMNGTTTGGVQGDSYDFKDIGTNLWEVTGTSKSSGTAATPFSTATT